MATAGWVGVCPAHAGVYNFVIPTTTIQNALSDAIVAAQPANPLDPNLYAFYDIYVRPSVAGETADPLPDYTAESATSPIPSGSDQWNASIDPSFDSPNVTFHFTYDLSDSVLALITPNTDINGVTIEGRIAEKMPDLTTFQVLVSSSAPLLERPVQFQVFGFAYQLFDPGPPTPITVAHKGEFFQGSFTIQPEAVPEPATWFAMAGGLVAMAIFAKRQALTSFFHIS